MRVLPFALAYFAICFGAGSVLGPVRELVIRPRLGEVGALLIEVPIMVVVSFLAARLLLGRAQPTLTALQAGAMGVLAFGMLLGAEFSLAFWLREQSVEASLARFATLPGTISLVVYLAFAALPWLLQVRAR